MASGSSANTRNAGLPSCPYARAAGTVVASDTTTAVAAAKVSALRPSASMAVAASSATGTMSGNAYRIVAVSWKRRWKMAYGANAIAHRTSARQSRQPRRAAPTAASTSIATPNRYCSHGQTNEFRIASAATFACRVVHNITTPEKSSPAWEPSAVR